jgi:hypothetical protein
MVFNIRVHEVSRPNSFFFLNRCTVCLNDFEENEEVKQLPCKHYFHTECIEKWLQQKDACPLCNAGIDTTSSKSKSTTAAADVAAQ